MGECKKNLTFVKCPICKEPLEIQGSWQDRVTYKKKEGLVFVLGGSPGGWGRRYDKINFREEVCIDCFNEVTELSVPLLDFINGKTSRKKKLKPKENKSYLEIFGYKIW